MRTWKTRIYPAPSSYTVTDINSALQSLTTRIQAQQGTYLARHHRYPLWSIGVQQESISLLARAWRCLHHTPVHSPGSRMTTNLAQCPHKVQTAALAYVAGAFKCGMAKTGMLQRTSCTWQNVPKDRTTGTMCRLTKDFPPTTLRRRRPNSRVELRHTTDYEQKVLIVSYCCHTSNAAA